MTSAALESGCFTRVAWSLAAQSEDYSQQTSSCAGFLAASAPMTWTASRPFSRWHAATASPDPTVRRYDGRPPWHSSAPQPRCSTRKMD